MIIPIRCYNCNKLIANKYRKYQQLLFEHKEDIQNGKKTIRQILEDDLGFDRICCKTLITGHVDIIQHIT